MRRNSYECTGWGAGNNHQEPWESGDNNGVKNGEYDCGERCKDEDGDGKIENAEEFSDENNNGTRDPGEWYADENDNGQWDDAE